MEDITIPYSNCSQFPPPLPPEGIAPRGSGRKPTTASILDGDPGRLEQAVEKEGGRATLRLKKDGQATVEEVVSHHSSVEEHGLKTVYSPYALFIHL